MPSILDNSFDEMDFWSEEWSPLKWQPHILLSPIFLCPQVWNISNAFIIHWHQHLYKYLNNIEIITYCMDRSASRYPCYSSHRQPGGTQMLFSLFGEHLITDESSGLLVICKCALLLQFKIRQYYFQVFFQWMGGGFLLDWVMISRQFHLKRDLFLFQAFSLTRSVLLGELSL